MTRVHSTYSQPAASSADTFDELRRFNPDTAGEFVFVRGRDAIGDGLEGTFYYDPDSALADDDNDTIASITRPTTTGRWRRAVEVGGGGGDSVNARLIVTLASRDPMSIGPSTIVGGKSVEGDGGGGVFLQCAKVTADNIRYFDSANGSYSWVKINGSPGQVQICGPGGSDLNDGLTYDSRRLTWYGAFDALPSAGGTIYCLNGTRVGGELAGNGQGIQLMSPFDPNYYSAGYPGYSGADKTSMGWRMTKVINCFGVGTTHAYMIPEPIAYLLPGASDTDPDTCTDPQYAGLWIAGGSDMMMQWRSLVWAYWYRPARLGIDSDRGTSWSWVAKNKFNDCGFISGIGTPFPSQVGDSLTASGGNVTLACSTYTFPAEIVGHLITISGCTNTGNNGLFTVATRDGDHSVTFANASGVTETKAFAWYPWILPVGIGPAVECGQLFWTYFNHCYFASPGTLGQSCDDGPAAAELTAEEAGAAILGRGGSMPASSCWIEHCISSQGGILYDCGAAAWSLFVKDWCTEGYYVNDVSELVKLTVNDYGKATLDTVYKADAAGTPSGYDVVIDGNDSTDPSCLETKDCGVVKGPHMALDLKRWPGWGTESPAIARDTTGFLEGRVVARHDGVIRSSGTVIAGATNLAVESPTLTSGVSLSVGDKTPWGTDSVRATKASGTGYATYYQAAIGTVSVGDHVLMACLMKSPGGSLQLNGDLYGATNHLIGAQSGYMGASRSPYTGDGEWRWEVVPLTYDVVNNTNPTLQATIVVPGGTNVDFVPPVVNVIRASEMSDNEFSEYWRHIATVPPQAVAGTAYGPAGVNQVIDGDHSVTGDSDVDGNADVAGNSRTHGDEEVNGNLLVDGDLVLQGMGGFCSTPSKFLFYPLMDDAGSCTWTIVPSPCPDSNAALIAQGWPSMTSGVTDAELWYCDEEEIVSPAGPANLVGKINAYEWPPYAYGANGPPTGHVDFMSGSPHARKFGVQAVADQQIFLYTDASYLNVGTQDFSVSILLQGTAIKHKFWVARGYCTGGAGGWALGAMDGSAGYPIGLLLRDSAGNQKYHNTNIVPADDDTPYLVTVSCDRDGLTSFYVNRLATQTVTTGIPATLDNAYPYNGLVLLGAQAFGTYTMYGIVAWVGLWIGAAIDRTGHDNLARSLRL